MAQTLAMWQLQRPSAVVQERAALVRIALFHGKRAFQKDLFSKYLFFIQIRQTLNFMNYAIDFFKLKLKFVSFESESNLLHK